MSLIKNTLEGIHSKFGEVEDKTSELEGTVEKKISQPDNQKEKKKN